MTPGDDVTEIEIGSDHDIILVRRAIRSEAQGLGFGMTDVTRIITAASELARNIHVYASRGVVRFRRVDRDGHGGLELVFEDHGPGIEDVDAALQPGFTTSRGLGLGLPGARRLMDEMEIRSRPGEGTVVVVRKWLA